MISAKLGLNLPLYTDKHSGPFLTRPFLIHAVFQLVKSLFRHLGWHPMHVFCADPSHCMTTISSNHQHLPICAAVYHGFTTLIVHLISVILSPIRSSNKVNS